MIVKKARWLFSIVCKRCKADPESEQKCADCWVKEALTALEGKQDSDLVDKELADKINNKFHPEDSEV